MTQRTVGAVYVVALVCTLVVAAPVSAQQASGHPGMVGDSQGAGLPVGPVQAATAARTG